MYPREVCYTISFGTGSHIARASLPVHTLLPHSPPEPWDTGLPQGSQHARLALYPHHIPALHSTLVFETWLIHLEHLYKQEAGVWLPWGQHPQVMGVSPAYRTTGNQLHAWLVQWADPLLCSE